jgi:hypothetical protein
MHTPASGTAAEEEAARSGRMNLRITGFWSSTPLVPTGALSQSLMAMSWLALVRDATQSAVVTGP